MRGRQMECKVKIENRIVELLDRNISFEIIYKTLKEENYKEAKRLTRLISVIEDRILSIYGYEKMKQYFINMLVEKYNNEYEWEIIGWRKLINGLGLGSITHSPELDTAKCLIEAGNYVYENFLQIPQKYSEMILEEFKNKKIFSLQKLLEYKFISTSKYLEQLLCKNFTIEEIEDYFETMMDQVLKNEFVNKRDLMFKLFGLTGHGPCVFKDIVEKNFGNYTRYCKITEWEEGNYIKYQWARYTNEEIDQKLEEVNKLFLRDREVFSRNNILKKLYGIPSELSKRMYVRIFTTLPNSDYIITKIKEYSKTQPYELIKENNKQFAMGADRWIFYIEWRNGIRKKELDFSEIPDGMRRDFQNYLKTLEMSEIFTIMYVIVPLNKIIKRYNCKSFEDITEEKILTWMQEQRNVGIKGVTINNYLSLLRRTFRGLNKLEKYKDKPLKVITENIRVKNTHRTVKHEEYIPPEVAVLIDEHIDELELLDQVIYRLMRETGLRFGDQKKSKVSDVVLDKTNPQYALFYYYESKVAKSKIKSEKYEKRFVHISRDLYNLIQKFIKETENIRIKFGTDDLLVNVNNRGRLCSRESHHVLRVINDLIDKYDIKTEDGKKWHFRNRQLRKTVAVDLISNGASTYNVRSALGHLNPQTTEIYYAEVEKMQILKKNTKFFQQKFKLFLGKDALKEFTEQERQILYADFLKQQREVEFGFCCKHPKDNVCSSIGCNSCASCAKLVTGKKFLPKWERLLKESEEMIEEYERIYVENNIPREQYEKFKEYSRECELRDKYQSVVDAINSMKE